MKKIILLIALFISSLMADVKYIDIFDAYDKAASEHKKVMVMLSKEGCPGCEYMESIVFKNKDVENYLQKNFVVVHVDIDKDGLPDGMDYFATPTFYFQDADNKILKRLNGGKNAKDFLETLKEIKAKK